MVCFILRIATPIDLFLSFLISSIINSTIFSASIGLGFLEIKVKKGARKNLSRPTISPSENKKNFIEFLNNGSNSNK